ncbi:MAG TPA: metalloregulator ArsR/SmtB family transcription factor [Fibrobacteria bacterium]|nr:metalloregulator ArsR/SmtB family transcription factor [Fibrobacteria bacterium]
MAAEKVLQIDVLTGVFKLLSDETRLRILSLLREGELAVGELQKVLGLGQSTLSTQLGLLKEQELVASRKEGQKVFYRIPGRGDDGREDPRLAILASALESTGAAKWHARDMRNLRKVLEERSEKTREFFNSMAVQNLPSPGQTWKALCNGLIRLIRGQRIVDLGCGNGRLSILLARAGNHVTGVDSSEEQIRLAREKAAESGAPADPSSPARTSQVTPGVEFLRAPMEATGLPAGGHDIVIFSQSLHHAAKPREAVAESYRLLAKGGRILILDLLAHGEEWMRSRFGDFWLGFSQADLEGWLKEAGFREVHVEITGASKDYPDIEGLLVQAEKP